MVEIPAGCFDMGSPRGKRYDDARPQHRVCVDAFSIIEQRQKIALSLRTERQGDIR
jgi:formylglycine-generating enzyme required for sulfatase activity